MIASVPTTSDYEFFSKRYVLYDPVTHNHKSLTFEDVSRLQNVRVIFIPEVHHSSVLKDDQEEALRRLAQNVSCCVLTEALKRGEVLRKMPGWEKLGDNITFHGSDNRASLSLTAEEFRQRTEHGHKFIRLHKRQRELNAITVQAFAGFLNEALKCSTVKIDETLRALVLPSSGLQTFNAPPEAINERKKNERELDKLGEILRLDGNFSADVEKSNRGLGEEIVKKASEQFAKIVAIWGLGHFYLVGNNLYNILKVNNISYAILLPSKDRYQEALIEKKWQAGKEERLPLTVCYGSFKMTHSIPREFSHHFHDSIRKLFVQPDDITPKVLHSLALKELLKTDRLELVPTPQAPLRITEICPNEYLAFDENLKISGELNDLGFDCLVEGINSVLMLGNKILKSMQHNGLNISPEDMYVVEDISFMITGNGVPFAIEVIPNVSRGNLSHLFRQMQKHSVNFDMQPNGVICLKDITPQELELILDKPQDHLCTWMQSKAPINTQVIVEGDVGVCKLPLTTSRGKISDMLVISTRNGCKISLTPRPE